MLDDQLSKIRVICFVYGMPEDVDYSYPSQLWSNGHPTTIATIFSGLYGNIINLKKGRT